MTTTTPSVASETRVWKDHKRYLWLLGLLVPLLPFGAADTVRRTGLDIFWWLGPIWILVLIPIADALFAVDESNPPAWAVPQLEDDHYYRWVTYLFLPIELAVFVWGGWKVTTGDLSWFAALGLTITMGSVTGIAIANAHELGHKKEKVERWLSKVVLAPTGYGHFHVEHNRGHHARVATPEDPASSRLGESFFRFLPRTVGGSMRSAWRLESARLRNQGRGVWTWRNDVLNAWAISVVLFAGMIAAFGPKVIPYIVIQAVFGFSLLEVVNYVEHYGLLRQKDDSGRYERCLPKHSWNSNHVASNVFLYHLERHSDHHAHPTRRYQSLRHFDDSPQLPSGYGLMIGLAYLPPVWRRMMDQRVLEHYDGDVTKANIQPSKRAKMLARYGAGYAPATAATPADR
jgi:alkane 1-monooxygenase